MVFLPAILFSFIFFNQIRSCSPQNECKGQVGANIQARLVLVSYNIRTRIAFESIVKNYSTIDLVGQMFMVTISGTQIDEETTNFLINENIGGIALLGSNITSPTQLKTLTSKITYISNINPFIAGDQEGGTVTRISWDASSGTSAFEVGKSDSQDFAQKVADDHAIALTGGGMNTNLGPVVDICSYNNPFLTTRCFANDSDKVSNIAGLFLRQYKNKDLVSVAKHFPNHGRTETDSHESLPIVNVSKEELFNYDLKPYEYLIENDIPMIMMSHVKYPQIDPDKPASLSKTIQTDLLRNEMGYDGIIISDDMRMDALNPYPEKIIEAVNAGTDIIILTNSFNEQLNYINQLKNAVRNGSISESRIIQSINRIVEVKCRYKILDECK